MVVRKPTYKKWWLDFQGIYINPANPKEVKQSKIFPLGKDFSKNHPVEFQTMKKTTWAFRVPGCYTNIIHPQLMLLFGSYKKPNLRFHQDFQDR